MKHTVKIQYVASDESAFYTLEAANDHQEYLELRAFLESIPGVYMANYIARDIAKAILGYYNLAIKPEAEEAAAEAAREKLLFEEADKIQAGQDND